MKVTIELLEKMPSGNRACSHARKWFRETFPPSQFPDGVDWVVAWDRRTNLYWKIWFTCHYLTGKALSNLAFRFAGQAVRLLSEGGYEALSRFADKVNENNWDEVMTAIERDVTGLSLARFAPPTDAVYWAANTTTNRGLDRNAISACSASHASLEVSGFLCIDPRYVIREQVSWCLKALKENEK